MHESTHLNRGPARLCCLPGLRIWMRVVGALWLGVAAGSVVVAQETVHAPEFSVGRGFYETPVLLALSSATPGAEIYFTTDGSEPSAANGVRYGEPLRIQTTTVVRAVAVVPSGVASPISTHTYLFIDQVLRQPRSIPGWPEATYDAGFLEPPELPTMRYFNARHDYEMDPAIVGDASTRDDLLRGLREIPTLSLVMPKAAFWEVNDAPRGSDLEHGVSVEALYPDGTSEQTQGGLVGHSHARLKRSFRLAFRARYGDARFNSRIVASGPLDGETAANSYDVLVLRAGNNRSWAHIFNDGRAAYTRDQWYRSTQIAMEGFGTRGTFVHLYINGLYWGLYNVAERPDTQFTSDYLGGEPEDWFAYASYSNVSGDPKWFNEIWQVLNRQDLSDPVWYESFTEHLDVANFSDYLILTWYMGMTDWPQKNFWGGNRNWPKPRPFLHFAWDGEWSFDVTHGSNNGGWVHPWFTRSYTGTTDYIPNTWRAARGSREFMTLFSDRVYKHLSEGGALSDASSRARWNQLNRFIRNAVVAESARWGDAMETNGKRTRTRALDWEPEVRRVDAIMDGNAERLKAALRAEGYYPPFDPPEFDRPGGIVPAGTPILLTAPEGALIYTTDGTDPRSMGGDISRTARRSEGSAEVAVTTGLTIKARVRQDSVWSALTERTYYTEQNLSELVINEVHYHPLEPTAVDEGLLEFVELTNRGSSRLELGGLTLSSGADYTFPVAAFVEPGGFIVLARDKSAFRSRYGFEPDGEFGGRLANEGELLLLSDPAGGIVDSVLYDDRLPWPEESDGMGPSLELRDPGEDNAVSLHWKASRHPGGSPGRFNADNDPPTVRFSAPEDGTRVDPRSMIALTVDASDDDGRVERVILTVGTLVIGEDETAPYVFEWTPGPGVYDLVAEAIDNVGWRTRTSPFRIHVRTEAPCSPSPPRVVLNEINYHSPGFQNAGDWVEFANADSVEVDLSGWVFKDEADQHGFEFPPSTVVDGRGFSLVVESDSLFRSVHPTAGTVAGAFGGPAGFSLDNGGEVLRLYSPTGCLVDTVRFDDAGPWPLEPDGGGPTLALIHPALDNALAQSWSASARVGGTPGEENLPNRPPAISITYPESGMRFDPGTPITVKVDAVDPNPGGSIVWVKYFVESEELAVVTAPPFSFRWERPRVGTYRLRAVAMDDAGERTSSEVVKVLVEVERPCAVNPGRVVINEINYHPDPYVAEGDWLELYNSGSETIDLAEWVVKVGGDLRGWIFPEGSAIGPKGFVVLPQDTTQFRFVHPSAGPLIASLEGSASFTIGNDGDRIHLYSPAGCLVDDVTFGDRSPWPEEPDGGGVTLALRNPGLNNADPLNWGVSGEAGGTPGAENVPNLAPLIELVSPVPGGRFDPTGEVRFIVSAKDPDAGDVVDRVVFLVEGIEIGIDTQAPFETDWKPPLVGLFHFQARAMDSRGAQSSVGPVSFTVAGEASCEPEPARVVVNEINFQPLPVLYDGDWIEVHNPTDRAASLEGWVLKGGSPLRGYVFSARDLAPGEYAVVVEDSLRFALVHAAAGATTGPLGYALHNFSDHVSLWSDRGCLVDSLVYASVPPWPEKPAGEGYTLSLRSPEYDNALAESWAASSEIGGSPGRANFQAQTDAEAVEVPVELPTSHALHQNFPNPFVGTTTIGFELPTAGRVRVLVYNLLGDRVTELLSDYKPAGLHEVRFDGAGLASGLYVVVLEAEGVRLSRRMALLR